MYNSSTYRKQQPSADTGTDRFRKQAQQLQELFPAWSNEDLQSLLVEVNGDVEVAAGRISEGHAEQWGSVQRKKDKKSQLSTPQSSSKELPGNKERAEFRGVRGGRGGRGGPGRGGAARGAFARGGHQDTNGRQAKPGSSKPSDATTKVNGDAAPTPVEAIAAKPEDASAPAADVTATPSESAVPWTSTTPATWGGDTATLNGSTTPAAVQPTPATAKVQKTPATSKMSWAQIAKPQEKPTPPPASVATPAVAPPSVAPVAATPEPTPAVSVPEPALAPGTVKSESSAEPAATGWEEPTTVQAPTWDDEPAQQTEGPEVVVADVEVKKEEVILSAAQPEPVPTFSALPTQIQPVAAKLETVQAPAPIKPLTPAAHTRPTSAAHRHKFKADQAVIMPGGGFGASVEKIGMQFGSLSLGDDIDSSGHEVVSESANARSQEHVGVPEPSAVPASQPPALQVQTQATEPSATTLPSQAPLSTQSLFQQAIPQQAQQQPVASSTTAPSSAVQPSSAQHQAHTALPSSLSQPALPAQVSAQPQSSASASNISSYSHHIPAAAPSLPSHQLPQQAQTQSQGGLLSQQHQFAQHSLPTHLDSSHSQQATQSPQVSQATQQGTGHSSYFRQQDQAYFHTPTPPVSATQSQESPYGSFGQLSGQLGHQNQASHLGGFGGQDYPYGGESQRNFYDSYTGPSGFGNRNVLAHDDIKSLPGAPQPPHGAPGLPPANAQPSQQLPQSSQNNSQSQPTGQGHQQYPPPLPYYYTPYPQNQYYGTPYSSGYSVPQPFVKYPAVFQGPPGPQSAPSPATKQAPSAVPSQSPYGQTLYGQQHSSSPYGDIDYQHTHGQSVGSLPSNEYGKQLYGGSGQGMQGFMGLGQNSGPTSGPPLGQRSGGSPEAAYKPYGSNVKDVSTGGVGASSQGPQGRAGVQQPQGSFYNAQRFSGGTSTGPQGQGQQHQPQAQGPQGHLGYPQGSSDASFYSYQPRQQQGYWQ